MRRIGLNYLEHGSVGCECEGCGEGDVGGEEHVCAEVGGEGWVAGCEVS